MTIFHMTGTRNIPSRKEKEAPLEGLLLFNGKAHFAALNPMFVNMGTILPSSPLQAAELYDGVTSRKGEE